MCKNKTRRLDARTPLSFLLILIGCKDSNCPETLRRLIAQVMFDLNRKKNKIFHNTISNSLQTILRYWIYWLERWNSQNENAKTMMSLCKLVLFYFWIILVSPKKLLLVSFITFYNYFIWMTERSIENRS